LWAALLPVTVEVTTVSLLLKRRGRPGLGALLSLVLAVGVLAALFLLLVLVPHPRWN
jgi:hypothetical protein